MLVDFAFPNIGFDIVMYSILGEIIQVLRRGVTTFDK